MSDPVTSQHSASSVSRAEPTHRPEGETPPRPENPPPPTCWPFVTAVGLTICFWGIVLNLLVVCVGAGVFLIGMGGLVGDWVREHRNQPI
jgi:hypothetical protein